MRSGAGRGVAVDISIAGGDVMREDDKESAAWIIVWLWIALILTFVVIRSCFA